MTKLDPDKLAEALERVSDLAAVGASQAAGALAQIMDRPFDPRVPMVRVLQSERADTPFVGTTAEDVEIGIFFEVDGGLGGILALLFSRATAERVLVAMAGGRERLPQDMLDSALRELGNMVISHVVSAMGDNLGVVVVPSIPVLAPEDPVGVLSSLIALRRPEEPSVRVETEVSDRTRDVRALLVFVPDSVGTIAPAEGF